ncbi:hypothetical protein MJT46_006414 [Ovis ammon polii x Ovis aries]|nr:hypothetical protein MJT46_006414 [Ovis ammon polii x Ovis aries]
MSPARGMQLLNGKGWVPSVLSRKISIFTSIPRGPDGRNASPSEKRRLERCCPAPFLTLLQWQSPLAGPRVAGSHPFRCTQPATLLSAGCSFPPLTGRPHGPIRDLSAVTLAHIPRQASPADPEGAVATLAESSSHWPVKKYTVKRFREAPVNQHKSGTEPALSAQEPQLPQLVGLEPRALLQGDPPQEEPEHRREAQPPHRC